MKVKSGTGVTPVSGRFHHLMALMITNANAKITPNDMIVVSNLSPFSIVGLNNSIGNSRPYLGWR